MQQREREQETRYKWWPVVVALAASAIVLHILDFYTTVLILQRGGSEANLLAAFLYVHLGLAGFVLIKALAILATLFIAAYILSPKTLPVQRSPVLLYGFIGWLILFFVVLHNIHVLSVLPPRY